MRQLISDENFVTLLRAEGIVDMPKQLSTVASDVLGFEGNLGLETNSKTRAISEVDLQFGSIAAIFEEIAEANDLPGEFFAFRHGDSCFLEVREPISIPENITLIVCRLIVVKDKP